MPEFPLGRFVWFDLMTPDPDAAMAFYTQVFGWGTTPFEGSDVPYTMFTAGGTPLGGVVQLPPEATEAGAPPHWVGYVACADVDATVARAQELGGKVEKPITDVPDTGRFAVLADPDGAVFAVFTSANEERGEEAAPEVGRMSWHELMTTDHRQAMDFYQKLLDWRQLEAMDMGEAGTYQIFGASEMPAGGIMNRPQGVPMSYWCFYTRVADIGAALAAVREHGGQVHNGPMEVPGGDLVAQCTDPHGGMFAIHQVGGGNPS